MKKKDVMVQISNLCMDFDTIDGTMEVLRDVSITVHIGQVVGLVGETGCGKSITAKALLGILPMPPAHIKGGKIMFLKKNLLKLDAKQKEFIRQYYAYVPQDPMTSLSPVFQIGTIMLDSIIWRLSNYKLSQYILKRRRKRIRKMAEDQAVALLAKVHIPDPRVILNKYPIELSGGMRQRILLAMALTGEPKLLIADEPTTALDVTIQKRTLLLIEEMVAKEKLSGLYITHNLGVARLLCEVTYVMYGGTVVESARTPELIDTPLHPYTQGLVNSIPKLTGEPFRGIDGRVPDYLNPPSGCRFHTRCNQKMDVCSQKKPQLTQVEEGRLVSCWVYN